jgi:hypothetical protein
MTRLRYTIADNVELIYIDGIKGTCTQDIHYSLHKANITKFIKNINTNSISIITGDSDFSCDYRELKDPRTGVGFTSLNTCAAYLESLFIIITPIPSPYPVKLFSKTIIVRTERMPVFEEGGAGWITIRAYSRNTDVIVIGNPDIDPRNGFNLYKNESITIEHNRLSEIYVVSPVEGQICSIIGNFK